MSSYRLSKAAENDLIEIAEYGDEQFGVTQSNKYRDQLKRRFALIATQPLFFPEVNHIHEGYRRSVCGSHSIYYKIEGDVILIVRILGKQDLSNL